MASVTVAELAARLQRSVDEVGMEAGESAIRVAEGWFGSVGTIPEPVAGVLPATAWAELVQLAALAWSNPESLSVQMVGELRDEWAVTALDKILARVAAGPYGSGSGGADSSVTALGSFPPAPVLPWGDLPYGRVYQW